MKVILKPNGEVEASDYNNRGAAQLAHVTGISERGEIETTRDKVQSTRSKHMERDWTDKWQTQYFSTTVEDGGILRSREEDNRGRDLYRYWLADRVNGKMREITEQEARAMLA